MNLYGLFLDDERNPEDAYWINYPANIQWKVIRNKKDFLFEVARNQYLDIISFDHDLAIDDFSGYDAVKLLCANKAGSAAAGGFDVIEMPSLRFHTKNPVGLQNMQAYYHNFCKVYRVYERKI